MHLRIYWKQRAMMISTTQQSKDKHRKLGYMLLHAVKNLLKAEP